MGRVYTDVMQTSIDLLAAMEYLCLVNDIQFRDTQEKEGMYRFITESVNLFSISSLMEKLDRQIRFTGRQRNMTVIKEGPTKRRNFDGSPNMITFEYQTYYELWLKHNLGEFNKITIVINRHTGAGISGKLLRYKYLDIVLEVV